MVHFQLFWLIWSRQYGILTEINIKFLHFFELFAEDEIFLFDHEPQG